MKVKALARGTYGKFREPGDVFDIVDDEHLGSWMEPVDAKDREKFAEKIAHIRRFGRKTAGPDVPATTAQLKEIPQPKPNAKAATKV